jgi:lipoprotein-releasing system permease protein
MAQRYTRSWSKRKLDTLREQGLAPGEWSLTVFGLTRQGTLAGSGLGDQQTFRYVNDSDSGLVDVDMYSVYVDFDVLQKLCSMDGMDDGLKRANEIRIRLQEGVKLERSRQRVADLWRRFAKAKEGELGANLLGDVKVQTWKEFRRNQIAPAEREKTLMIVVFSMIGVVAVFIIFALFYMVVTEKIKDLGILKSVGGSSWGVGQIFLGYGALVGLVGAIAGSVLGCLIVWNSNEIEQALGLEIFDPDMYTIDRIPDVVDTSQALMIGLVAIVASVAGAALPAWRSGKLEVVEALRVE